MDRSKQIARVGYRGLGLGLLALSTAYATEFDIPAGNATDTLRVWSSATDMNIMFDYNIVEEVTTQKIKGNLDDLEALIQMLRGTGLRLDQVDARTIAVIPGSYPPCKPERGIWAPLPPCSPRLPTTTITQGIRKWLKEL